MASNKESTVFVNTINNYGNDRPTSFGRNRIGEHNYTVKIARPIPKVNFTTTTTVNNKDKVNNKNLTKRVKFSNIIKISDMDSVDDYDRCGQLGQKEENYKIDVWFTGETLAKTKYNMGRWINKNIYNYKEVIVALRNVNRKVERSKDNVDECRVLDLTDCSNLFQVITLLQPLQL
ncbi:hypothetical protein Glove_420g65 [Diversispora epigaea]|uniref:Uncharacterized protein n=1 Tax=Diversispora epigaea TaxID=1348612 RepID=A0A397H198_9GLOM|nr:hypothetical protein Glove_420g65 [Diversispora epigaea]